MVCNVRDKYDKPRHPKYIGVYKERDCAQSFRGAQLFIINVVISISAAMWRHQISSDTAFIRQVRAHDKLNTLITTYRCLGYVSLWICGRQKSINGQSLTIKSSGETTSLTTASMFPETGSCPRPLCHVTRTFATTLEWTAWRHRSTHKAKASRRFYS